jgi:hypothetical protein
MKTKRENGVSILTHTEEINQSEKKFHDEWWRGWLVACGSGECERKTLREWERASGEEELFLPFVRFVCVVVVLKRRENKVAYTSNSHVADWTTREQSHCHVSGYQRSAELYVSFLSDKPTVQITIYNHLRMLQTLFEWTIFFLFIVLFFYIILEMKYCVCHFSSLTLTRTLTSLSLQPTVSEKLQTYNCKNGAMKTEYVSNNTHTLRSHWTFFCHGWAFNSMDE